MKADQVNMPAQVFAICIRSWMVPIILGREDMKVVLMDRGCWSFIVEDEAMCLNEATEKRKVRKKLSESQCRNAVAVLIQRYLRVMPRLWEVRAHLGKPCFFDNLISRFPTLELF
ncbi:hypothetical protein AVEN_102358-1 [Araneus ventricosus]|uniref:Uncharacterized protein n=1 Tax=Araneus ventricosus TaxID=182803 RepID=A0A4Y2WFM1_ARAVE|nr:hypothetical protein AVEN_102358-1 [Araneus ventricosus]